MILMLAVGIGATTAVFSQIHKVLLRPLPVPEADRLVNLSAPGPKPGSLSYDIAGDGEDVFSYPMFRDLEARQTAFRGIAAHRSFDANLAYEGDTLAAGGMLVSGGYFPALNLEPALGRLIGPQDEPGIGASAVVVLSHDYWRNRFGADEDVIGRTLIVNGQPLTIIGVAPAGFTGTTYGLRPQVFVPLTLRWLMRPTLPQETAENRRRYWLYVFARLAPGLSVAQASARINSLYSGILNEVEAPLQVGMSDDELDRFRQRQITLEPGAHGQSRVPGDTRLSLSLRFAVTTLVLLIVWVNVANLLLARGLSRTSEMAIRASIGADRRHLVSQLLVEASVVASAGGLLGLPVAAAALRLIAAISPAEASQAGFGPSGAALLFAAAATLATVLAVGLPPALHAARADLGTLVKRPASQSTEGRGIVGFRNALVILEIGFSMVVLVLAGLFGQSLANIARIDLGMNFDSLVTFTISPALNGYDPERTMNLYDRVEEALAGRPEVTGVASAAIALLTNSRRPARLDAEGFEGGAGADTNAAMNEVSPGFFRVLSIPLLAGRDFTDADRLGSPRVAIVNEAFVRKFDLGNDPVGKRFDFDGRATLGIEIAGVVADAKSSEVKGDIGAQFFLPRRQSDDLGKMTFYVRSAVDPGIMMQTVRRVVAGLDPNLPVTGLRTMERQVQNNVFRNREAAILSAGLAALATLLGAIGLYGVLTYNVLRRTRELGLRLALGAEPGQLRATVLQQVGVMAAIGGVFGLAAALALGRAAEALLFGVSAYDLRIVAAAAIVLTAAVLGASYLPARRASRISPMEALRQE